MSSSDNNRFFSLSLFSYYTSVIDFYPKTSDVFWVSSSPFSNVETECCIKDERCQWVIYTSSSSVCNMAIVNYQHPVVAHNHHIYIYIQMARKLRTKNFRFNLLYSRVVTAENIDRVHAAIILEKRIRMPLILQTLLKKLCITISIYLSVFVCKLAPTSDHLGAMEIEVSLCSDATPSPYTERKSYRLIYFKPEFVEVNWNQPNQAHKSA